MAPLRPKLAAADPRSTGWSRPHHLRASPYLHRLPSPHAVLTTPVDRSGASVWFMMRSRIGFLPGPLWPSLNKRAGRHPQPSFRGLLKLHSRYGLRICSPTLCGLCHEAPIPSVNPAKRPVSYPVIPTTPGVGLPPTGNLRPCRGARLFRKTAEAPWLIATRTTASFKIGPFASLDRPPSALLDAFVAASGYPRERPVQINAFCVTSSS